MSEKREWVKVTPSKSWNFKEEGKGAEIEGIFIGKESNVGANNSNVYSIRTKDGIRSVWGTAILDVRLKNVQPGEEVKIVYLGTEKSQKVKGRTYNNFDVYHRPAAFEKVGNEDTEPTEDVDFTEFADKL